jgi:uncharacterized caspase-like protein
MNLRQLGQIFFCVGLCMTLNPTLSLARDATDRVALVIGNANYVDAQAELPGVIGEVRDLEAELKRDGFEVQLEQNLTREGMRSAFDQFYKKLRPQTQALIFFSGFGVQSIADNYLIPIDANIWTEADVSREGFPLLAALREIAIRTEGAKVVILDASRHNPFERRFRHSSMGLHSFPLTPETLVLFSAIPNTITGDRKDGHNMFIAELLKNVSKPGKTSEAAFKGIRERVAQASDYAEVPWVSSSLTIAFYFNEKSNSEFHKH